MTPTRHPLGDLTPADVLAAGRELWIFCAACRMNRQGDPGALSDAGKGATRLADLTFRCGTCGGIGKPYASGWHEGGWATWGS